jgi:dsDNA-binding SOS-regulon protein
MKKHIETLREISGLQIRTEILFYSLVIEGYVSFFLSKYLNIPARNETKCFSNRSSALSVYQKVNLFLDLGVIAKDEHWLFITFMEIRNQFMHNIEADSYEKCFETIDGEAKLLKRFSVSEELNKEQQLEKMCKLLFEELCTILDKIEDHVVDRVTFFRNNLAEETESENEE